MVSDRAVAPSRSFRETKLKLYIKDVNEGKKRPIEVPTWSTIKDVKDILSRKLHAPPGSIRLYYGPLLTSGKELPNYRTLHDAGIYRPGETLLLDIKGNCISSSPSLSTHNEPDIYISTSMQSTSNKFLRSLVARARRGLALGLKPELVIEGSGGTYFLHDSWKNKIAVFKPSDEEPYAENNPRGYLLQEGHSLSLRDGIAPGEACIREVAAFRLDNGFAGVPHTTLVEARHPAFNYNGAHLNVSQGGASLGAHSISDSPRSQLNLKPGSFQEFAKCECTIDDISPSKIAVKDVHKIAILDIRIMNADRNAANLLVRRNRDNTLELVPIDHGYCLRSVCDVSWMDWCWLDWPQLKEPLCDEHKEYIKNLDIEADAKMLRETLNIGEDAIDYLRASTALLKAGVAAGLTLYDIAIKCCRNDNLAEEPSMMEQLFGMASELAHVAVANERYHHSAASRALVDQLVPQSRRASLFPESSFTAKDSGIFGRSVSSVDFGSLTPMVNVVNMRPKGIPEETPGMAQTSASSSETSSDADDATEVNVEAWAENVTKDLMSGLNDPYPAKRPTRTSSFSSDDLSTDGSAISNGFWHVRPGSEECNRFDDGSVDWSPKLMAKPALDIRCDLADAPLWCLDQELPKETMVSFAEPKPPATVDITPSQPDVKPLDSGCMKRSKSYTALSASTGRKTITLFSPSKYTEDYAHYKRYFHKFIDLVIVRETTIRPATFK